MTIDWDAVLLGPVYEAMAVTGTITPLTSASSASVAMIDATHGAEIPGKTGFEVSTVKPVAYVRASVLAAASLTRADLRGAAVALNGKTYRVESSEPRPLPDGEDHGELMLILIER